MNTLNLQDLESRLGDAVKLREISSKLSISKQGPWLAGGSVRRWVTGEPINSDFDIFFQSPGQLEKCTKKLGNPSFSNDFSLTWKEFAMDKWKADIQAVRISFYENLESVLDSFDFTACQFGFDGENIVHGDFSLLDATRKRIVVHKITYAASSTRRLLKYGRQGFTVCTGAIASLLQEVANDPEVIRATVEYID